MKKTKDGFIHYVLSMAAIVILTTMLGFGFLSHSIRAQTISATPYSSYRYESPSATIQVKTTSTKSIWDAAIKKWNATHAFDFKLVSTGGTIQADSFSSLAPAYSTIAGITYSNYTGTQLLSAQTRLNTGILNKYRYTNAEKTNVAEHELGHTMGLLHNPSQKSVMYYKNRYLSIQPVDIAAVEKDYHTLIANDTTTNAPILQQTFFEPIVPKKAVLQADSVNAFCQVKTVSDFTAVDTARPA